MRIKSSKVLDAQMRALGRAAAGHGVFGGLSGLANGVVDGTGEHPTKPVHAENVRSAEYVALSNHGYDGYAVIVNKKILGRAAARHPDYARGRDARGN